MVVADVGPDRTTCVGKLETFYGGYSYSTDENNPITSYSWNFGDGYTSTGVVANHKYTSPGDYTLRLTVSNGVSTDADTANVHVIDEPDECNACNAQLSVLKNVACVNDTIAISINGIEDCEDGRKVTFILDGPKLVDLCQVELMNGYAACVAKLPDTPGKYNIYAYLDDTELPVVSTIKINNIPSTYTQLYGPNGEPLEAPECTDKNPLRMWEDVKLVSLPLHFSFGQMAVNRWLFPSSSISCGRDTYRFFTYGVNCYGGTAPNGPDCNCSNCEDADYYCEASNTNNANLVRWLWQNNPPSDYKYYACDSSGNILENTCYHHQLDYSRECSDTFCEYDTHEVTRTTYSWKYSYDIVNYVSSDFEFIPMFMGYNQSPVGGDTDKFTGSCTGDNNCYTEVPICGDGVCDTQLGERCWNCPSDCNASADGQRPDFTGHCSWGKEYCSRCPTTDPTFSDPRGCVIEFKEWGDEASCDLMCNPFEGLTGTDEQYGIGDTIREKLDPSYLENFRCCKGNETWNAERGRCEVKRGIVVDRVDLEFKRVSSDWCCGQLFMGKNNFGAVNVTLHIHNAGDVAETVTVKANLGVGLGSRFTLFDIVLPEVKLINLALGGKLEGYGEEQTRTVTIGAHNDGEVSFIWKCVVTDKGDCYTVYDFGEHGETPFLMYTITVDDPQKQLYGDEADINGYYTPIDICTTNSGELHTNPCEFDKGTTLQPSGDNFNILCGGSWSDVSNCAASPNPLSGFVADCNPFDNCGCSIINWC